MDALHQIGAIDKKTMRDFDTTRLADLPEMEPEEIRALREQITVTTKDFVPQLVAQTQSEPRNRACGLDHAS